MLEEVQAKLSECSKLLRVLPTPKLSECSELLRVLPPKLSELLRVLPTLLIRFPRKQ